MVWNSVNAPEFDKKHLKKAAENVNMKTIAQKFQVSIFIYIYKDKCE